MARAKKATSENPRTKAGAAITPEIADALAAEAERGYDLPLPRGLDARILASSGSDPELAGLAEYATGLPRDLA